MVARGTLTTELAGLARFGVNPSISALAVVIMGLTLIFAVIYEIKKRREEAITEASVKRAAMKRRQDTAAAAAQVAT